MSNIRIIEDEEGNLLPATEPQRFLKPIYTAASGLKYPERLPPDDTARVELDITNLPIAVYAEDVEKLDPRGFTMIRRNGFGGSDSGVLLGVNPFTPLEDLIKEKASTTISEEETAISSQIAVMKGNDLEPLVIDKFERIFQMKTVKPTDMYVFKEWDYLKMNFDGVVGTPEQYLPVEVKIVTKKGERHYDPFKAIYVEREGFKILPEFYADNPVNSIATKATQYGIPPYYYTQLQQEMMALNAPFGYLCTLWESDWTVRVFLVHQDIRVFNELKIAGWKAWQQVEALKEKKNAVQRISIISPEDQQSQSIGY